MARRKDHSREELKAMALDGAWRVVGEEGFEALTARRLAAEIGYAPGTIYNLFASMDDLYLAVNSRTLDALYETLDSPACNDPCRSPVQNMKAMAKLYMAFARDHRPHWLMLFSHRLPEGRKAEAWYQTKIDRLFVPLETILQPLFTNRQIQKRKMAARVLWSSVHGLCFLQETGKMPLVGGASPAETMAGYLIETFVKGIESA